MKMIKEFALLDRHFETNLVSKVSQKKDDAPFPKVVRNWEDHFPIRMELHRIIQYKRMKHLVGSYIIRLYNVDIANGVEEILLDETSFETLRELLKVKE